MSDGKKYLIGLGLRDKDLREIENRMTNTLSTAMENGMSLDRSGKAVIKKDMEVLLEYVRDLTSGISNSTPDIAKQLTGNLKNVLPMISGLADKMKQVNGSTDWMKQGFTFGDDIYTTIKALDAVQKDVADVRAEVSELTTALNPFMKALKANDPSTFFKKYGEGFKSVGDDASTMRATITKELKAIESSGSGLKNLMKDIKASSRNFVDIKSAEEALNIFTSLQSKLEIYEDLADSFGKGKAIEHDIEEVKDYAKALVELQNLSKNKFASNLFDVKGSTMFTGDIKAWLQEIKQSIDATVKQAGDTLQRTVDGLNLKEVQLSVVLPEADAKKIEQQANAWVEKFNEKLKAKPIQLSVDMADPFKTYKAKDGKLTKKQRELAEQAKNTALESLRKIADDETIKANFSGLDDPETSRILRKLAESFVKIRNGVELGQQSIADATKQWRTEMEKMLTLEFKFDTKSKLDPERIDALLEEVQEIFRNHSFGLNPNTELLVKDIEDAIKGKVFDIAINPKINGAITMPVSGVQWVPASGQSTTPPKSTPPISTPPTAPPTSQNTSVPQAVENVVRSAEQSAQINQETVVKANALTDALTKLTDDIATARTRHQGVQDIKDKDINTLENADELIAKHSERIKILQTQQANLRNSLIPTQKDLEQYGSLENFNNAIRDRIESVKRQIKDVDAEIENVYQQIENIKHLTPKGEIATLAAEKGKIRSEITKKEEKLIPTAEQISEAGSKDKWEEANAEEIKKLTEEIADLKAKEKAISEKIVKLRNEEAQAFEDSLTTDKRRKGAIEKVLNGNLDYKKLIVDNVNKFYAANDKRFRDLLPDTQQFDKVLGGKYNLGKQYGELIKTEQELSKFDPNRSEEKTAELQAKAQKVREEISKVVATVKTAVAKELQKLHVNLDETKQKLKTDGIKSLSASEKRALQLSNGIDNIRYLENNFTKRRLFEQLGFKNLEGVNATSSLQFVEEILKSSTTLSSTLGKLKAGDVKLSGTSIDDLKYFIPIVQETMGIVAQSTKEWEKTDALKQRFLGILDLARVISELYKIVPSDENGNIEDAIERFKHIFANVSTGVEDITKTIDVADAYLTKSKALSEMTGANAVYKAVVDNAGAENQPLLRMIQNTWSALPSGIKNKMKPYTGAIDIGALKDKNISVEVLTQIRDGFVGMFKSGVLDSEVFTKLREGSPELQKFYDALQLNARYLEKTAAEKVLKTTLFGQKRRTDDVGNIVQQKETGVIDRFKQAMNGNQPMAVTIVGENGQTLSYGYQSNYAKSKMDVDKTFSFGSPYAFEKFGIDELIAERNALQDGIIAEKLALESSIKYLEGSEEEDDQALLEKHRARLATIEEIMASETKMADYQASIAARLKAIDEEILSRFTLTEGKEAPKRTIRKDYAYENHPWVQAQARKANHKQLLAELDKTNEVNQDVLTKRVEKKERELQRKLTEDEIATERQDIAQKQRQELIERIKQEDAIIKDENQILDALRTLREDVDIARKKYEDASGKASVAKRQVKNGFKQINPRTGMIGFDYKQYKNHHIQTDLPPLTLEEAIVDKDGVISYKNSWGRFRDKLNTALEQHTMNPDVVTDLIAEIDTASSALEELMAMGGNATLTTGQITHKDQLRATIAKARQNIIDKYYEQEHWVVTNLIAETEETLRSQHDSVRSSAHGNTADINKKYDGLEQLAKDEYDRRVAEINTKYADQIILGTGEQEVIAEYNSKLQETRSEIRRARLEALDGEKRQELASITKQYQTEVSAISNQYTKGTDEYNKAKTLSYRNWAKAEIQVENKYKELAAKIEDEIKNANPNRLAELQSARDAANMQTVDGEIARLKAKAEANAKTRLDKLRQPTQSRVDATYTPLLQRVDTYTRGMSPSGVDGWKTAREIAINKVIDGEVLRLQEELRTQSVERLTTLASTLGADSSEYKDAAAIEKSELQKQLDTINKSAIRAQFEREQNAYNEAVSAHNEFVMSDPYRQSESEESERLKRELSRISSTRRRNTVTTQVEQAKIDTQQAFDDFIRQLAAEYQIELRSGSGDVVSGDKTAMQTELDAAAVALQERLTELSGLKDAELVADKETKKNSIGESFRKSVEAQQELLIGLQKDGFWLTNSEAMTYDAKPTAQGAEEAAELAHKVWFNKDREYKKLMQANGVNEAMLNGEERMFSLQQQQTEVAERTAAEVERQVSAEELVLSEQQQSSYYPQSQGYGQQQSYIPQYGGAINTSGLATEHTLIDATNTLRGIWELLNGGPPQGGWKSSAPGTSSFGKEETFASSLAGMVNTYKKLDYEAAALIGKEGLIGDLHKGKSRSIDQSVFDNALAQCVREEVLSLLHNHPDGWNALTLDDIKSGVFNANHRGVKVSGSVGDKAITSVDYSNIDDTVGNKLVAAYKARLDMLVESTPEWFKHDAKGNFAIRSEPTQLPGVSDQMEILINGALRGALQEVERGDAFKQFKVSDIQGFMQSIIKPAQEQVATNVAQSGTQAAVEASKGDEFHGFNPKNKSVINTLRNIKKGSSLTNAENVEKLLQDGFIPRTFGQLSRQVEGSGEEIVGVNNAQYEYAKYLHGIAKQAQQTPVQQPVEPVPTQTAENVVKQTVPTDPVDVPVEPKLITIDKDNIKAQVSQVQTALKSDEKYQVRKSANGKNYDPTSWLGKMQGGLLADYSKLSNADAKQPLRNVANGYFKLKDIVDSEIYNKLSEDTKNTIQQLIESARTVLNQQGVTFNDPSRMIGRVITDTLLPHLQGVPGTIPEVGKIISGVRNPILFRNNEILRNAYVSAHKATSAEEKQLVIDTLGEEKAKELGIEKEITSERKKRAQIKQPDTAVKTEQELAAETALVQKKSEERDIAEGTLAAEQAQVDAAAPMAKVVDSSGIPQPTGGGIGAFGGLKGLLGGNNVWGQLLNVVAKDVTSQQILTALTNGVKSTGSGGKQSDDGEKKSLNLSADEALEKITAQVNTDYPGAVRTGSLRANANSYSVDFWRDSVQAQQEAEKIQEKIDQMLADGVEDQKEYNDLIQQRNSLLQKQEKITLRINKDTGEITSKVGIENFAVGANAAEKELSKMQGILSQLHDAGALQFNPDGKLTSQNQSVNSWIQSMQALQVTRDKFASEGTLFDAKNNAILSQMTTHTSQLTKEVLGLLNVEGKFGGDVVSTFANPQALAGTSELNQKLIAIANTTGEVQMETVKFDTTTNTLSYTIRKNKNEVQDMTLHMNSLSGAVTQQAGQIRHVDTAWEKFGKSLKGKFQEVARYLMSFGSIYRIWGTLKQGVNYIKDIDTALTELKKVTDATDREYSQFLKTMSKTAGAVGSTTSELTKSAADWARLGYSIEQAGELAKSTAILMNVSEFDDVNTATEALISSLQAFNYTADDSIKIVDKLNIVGNNFAISSDGIAEGLKRSASTLVAAGNSLEQSIAMLAAGNKVAQDPEALGNALKVLSMRIRGTKTDLEEAGEETDGLITNTSKLQEKIKALTNVDGNGGVDILTDAGAYRSTYDILLDIAEIWDDINSVDPKNQAALLEILAGKTRGSQLAAILQNPEDLRDAYEMALDSDGSAAKELETYLDSIQGKIQQFTNSVQTLWMNLISSKTVKSFVDWGTKIINSLDTIPGKISAIVKALALLMAFKKINPFESIANIVNLINANGIGATIKNLAGTLFGVTTAMKAVTAETVANTIATQTNDAAKTKQIMTELGLVGVTGTLDQAQKQAIATKILDMMTTNQLSMAQGNAMLAMLGYAGATMTADGSLKILDATTKSFMATNPIGWILAIVSVVMTVVSWISSWSSGTEKLEEDLNDLNSEISSMKSEIDSLNSELETTQERMAELLAMDSLSFTEEEELQNLKLQNAELERQLKLQEALLKSKEAEQKEKAKEVIASKWDGEYADKAYAVTNGVITKDKWYISGKSGKDVLDSAIPVYEEKRQVNDKLKQAYSKALEAQKNNEKIDIETFRNLKIGTDTTNRDWWRNLSDDKLQEYLDTMYAQTTFGTFDGLLNMASKQMSLNDTTLKDMESGINLVLGDMSKTIIENGLSYSMNDDEVDRILDKYYAYSLKFANAQGAASKSSVISAIWDNTESESMKQLKSELDEVAKSGEDRAKKQVNAQKLIGDALKDETGQYERLQTFMEAVGVSAEEMANYFVAASEAPDIKTLEGVFKVFADGEEVLKQSRKYREQIKTEMTELQKDGSVDLFNRKQIKTSDMMKSFYSKDKYAEVLAKELEGVTDQDLSTVWTQTFSNKDFGLSGPEIAMNFTPILPDGKVMEKDEFETYVAGVLAGAEDTQKLKIGATFDGENAIEEASKVAERIHVLQEDYFAKIQLGVDKSGEAITWDNLFNGQDGEKEADPLKISAILEGADEGVREQFTKLVEAVENEKMSVDEAFARWEMVGIDKMVENLNTEFEDINNEMFADVADDIDGVIDTVKELQSALESVASTMDTLHTAQEQMNSSGRVSVKTALELMTATDEWDKILNITEDSITLKNGAEQELIQTELEAIKVQTQRSAELAKEKYEMALAAAEAQNLSNKEKEVANTQNTANAVTHERVIQNAGLETQMDNTSAAELEYAANDKPVQTAESVKAKAIGLVSSAIIGLDAALTAFTTAKDSGKNKWKAAKDAYLSAYNEAKDAVMVDVNSLTTTVGATKKDYERKKGIADVFANVDDYSGFKNYYDYDKTPGDKYKDDDSDSKDPTELDWLDHYLTDVENQIEEHQARLENIVMDTDYLKGDNTIFDQIIGLYDEKSKKMQDALATYNSRADYLFGKLPSWVQTAINNGSLDISSIADEDLAANIEEYYEYVDAASNLTVELENLKQEIADIAKQKFDNIVEAYENMLNLGGFGKNGKFDFDGSQAYVDSLQKQIDLAEASGEEVGEAYYQAMIDAYTSDGGYIDILEAQKAAMQDSLDDAVRNNQITVGSEQWYEMVNAIYDVDGAIIDAKISLEEWQTSINDMNSESFDDLINKIDHLASEIDFLYGLLSDDDKVVDEFGNWTGEGIAALGLMAQEMERAKEEAELYGKEIDALNAAYDDGKYSQEEYEEKLMELKEGQWSAIEAAESAKDAIIDLNKVRVESAKKVIQDEIDAYSELIEKKREELDAEKEAYDFQKKVQESQKSISDIQRRLNALSNDNSASANAERRKLQAELNQSLTDLEEIYYEESISNQQDALDKELEDYEEARQDEMDALDEYLKNVEQVVQDSLTVVIANADTALETLNTYATEHGFTLSEELKTPWVKAAEEATAFKNSATGELGALIDSEGILQTWKIDATDDLVAPWTSGEGAIDKFSYHVTTALSTLRGELDTAATNASKKAQQIIADMKSAMSEITKTQNAANNVTYTPNVGGNGNVGSSGSSGSGSGSSSGSSSGGSGTGGVGGATSSDPNVIALQKFLNNYFNAKLSVDGIYGSLTKAAVKKMQQTIGNKAVDGLYDSDTGNKLYSYFSNLLKLTNKEVAMGGDVSQYKEYYKNARKAIPLACYAKGTTGVKDDQWALTDELGPELTLHAGPNGQLQYLTKGSGVVTADLTKRLMEWGELDPTNVLEQSRVSVGAPHITTNNFDIDLSFGSLVHVDHCDQNTLPDLQKMVRGEFDSMMKTLNQKLKRK